MQNNKNNHFHIQKPWEQTKKTYSIVKKEIGKWSLIYEVHKKVENSDRLRPIHNHWVLVWSSHICQLFFFVQMNLFFSNSKYLYQMYQTK